MKFEEGQSEQKEALYKAVLRGLESTGHGKGRWCIDPDPLHSTAWAIVRNIMPYITEAAHELAHSNWRTMEAETDWEVDNG